jgi:Dyp-type peroxidase family
MFSRRELLGDPDSEAWRKYRQDRDDNTIHAMVLLADADWTRLRSTTQSLLDGVRPFAQMISEEEGHQLKVNGLQGERTEHFGYRDGISQPLYFAADVEEELKEIANPVWDPGAGPSTVLVRDPFIEDADASGSYLVFRKLEQHVDQFQAIEQELCQRLGAQTSDDRIRVESMIVGRSRAGIPLVGSPPSNMNDFTFKPDDVFPYQCPLHAHIRKANPRRDVRVRDDFKNRRIARRSITYGVDPETLTALGDRGTEKGILFMCYQSSLAGQFEFIQRFWLDDIGFPMRGTGTDPIVGGFSDQQLWNLSRARPARQNIRSTAIVSFRGGEYFFTPSLAFLRSL